MILIIAISCKAQIVDVNTSPVVMTQGGYYAKDSNNEFALFLGTWEATWDNKKIILYLSKVTHHYNTHPRLNSYYNDYVVGKYKVIDLSTGAVLEDTTGNTNVDTMPIESTVLIRNKNQLRFLYTRRGLNTNDCGILSHVILTKDLSNPNILNYKYLVDSHNYKYCSYTNIDDIPVNIPKQEVVLHKL